ncbi:MAG: type II toxin-antitoxin system RelE/ParE family toxin [Rhodovibrio sp.]|nr:type II toxin-antitoxin system RelE/ParE family toxin [Rhodovibrio sp.]
MQVVWSARARRDLSAIQAFIAQDDPTAAERVETAVVELTRTLARHPYIGHRMSARVREVVERRYRYVVRYGFRPNEAAPEAVIILSIWHPKQAR